METQQSNTEIATLIPQGVNGNHNEVSISYEEYKALEAGFLEEKRKLEDRMWLDSNMSRFDEILRQNYDSSIRKFSEKVITYLAKVTGAVYGAFFTVDYETHTVNATGGYACTIETMDRVSFKFGEGLVGQVAKSKEIMCLDNVETQLDSSLGRISACFLTISPLVFNDRVYGIVELTTLNKLKPRYIILLERMSRSVAAVLQSLLNNQRTKELLIESLNQSEEFKRQHEEIRKRDEVLQGLRDQLQLKEQEIQRLVGNFQMDGNGFTPEAYSNLNAELLAAQAALGQMRTEWQAQQAEITKLTALKAEYDAQNEKLKAQDQKIHDLSDSLHWKHEEIERQGNALQERKQELERLQGDLAAKEAENKRFLEEIIRQEKSLQQKEQTLASLHAQLKETVANAHVPLEIDSLKEALAQKDTLVQQLQQALEMERISYVEQVESMQKAGEEIEQKSNALQDIEQRWHIQTQIWQSWQETAQEREKELQTLLAEREEKNNLIADLQARYSQKEELAQQLDAELTQLKADYEAQHSLLDALKEEATQKDASLQGIKEELRVREVETHRQQREIQDLQARLSKKEDELLVSQYMFNQMQANPLLSKETERLNQELEKKEQEIKHLQSLIAREDIQPTLQPATSPDAENQEAIEHLQTELARYTEAYEALNRSFEEVSEDLNNVKQYAEMKEGEVENLLNQLMEAQNEPRDVPEISSLVAELRQKESLVGELQEKLKNQSFFDSVTPQTDAEGAPEMSLVAELRQKETLIGELQEKLNAFQSPDSFIQQQYQNIQQKIRDLEIVQTHLLAREKEFKQHKEAWVAKCRDWAHHGYPHQAIAEQSETLQQKYQDLETTKAQLLAREAEFQQNREAWEARCRDWAQHHYPQLMRNLALQAQPENVEGQIREIEAAKAELAAREAEFEKNKQDWEAKSREVAAQTIDAPQGNNALALAQEELKQLRNQIEFKQEEMRKRELELATLFNKINNAFAMLEIDMQGRVLSANNKMLFHLGLAAEEMVLQEYSKFLKPEFVASNEYRQLWSEFEKVGSTQVLEDLVMIGRKEREMKMNVTFVPILDQAGKPYEIIQVVNFLVDESNEQKMMVYSKDFSELENLPAHAETSPTNVLPAEQPQATAELDFDEEREIFKAIQSSFMLLELDMQGRITTANHQMALCLGYDDSDLVGKLHAVLLHSEEQESEGYQEILARLSEGHYATQVLTYVGKEGEKIRLRSYFNPLKDKDDQTRKVLVMSQYTH